MQMHRRCGHVARLLHHLHFDGLALALLSTTIVRHGRVSVETLERDVKVSVETLDSPCCLKRNTDGMKKYVRILRRRTRLANSLVFTSRRAMTMKALLTVIGFVIISTIQTFGQCDSLAQAMTDTTTKLAPLDANGNIDTSAAVSVANLTAAYIYHYSSDSSRLRFEYSELMMNRKKLFLDYWCRNRVMNWDSVHSEPYATWTAQEMRDRSKTRVFPVSAGDTLQFYRTYWWIDRLTSAVSYNRYINDNGISYSVELVNASSGARILQMDTLAFGTTTSTKKPCINGWYPPLSRVRAFVPSSVSSNTSVYVRINMYDGGTTPRPFVRVDQFDFMQSQHDLGSSSWMAYSDSVRANISCSSYGSCDVTASASTSPRGVNVSIATSTAIDRVRIYDVYGSHISTSTVPLSSNPLFVGTNSGLFIVVGETSGSVVCTRNVLVP